jgi:hypothetical protein
MFDKFPSNMNATAMKNAFQVKLPPPGSNAEPKVPDAALPDVGGALGSSVGDAIKKCLNEHPLAALDPRFPPQYNVGKMFSLTWFDAGTNFMGWTSPYF